MQLILSRYHKYILLSVSLFFFFLIDGDQRNLYKKDTYVLKSEQEVLKESARKDHIKYRIFFTQW